MKNILTVIVHQENASGDHDEKMFLPFGAADPDRLTARIVVRLCGNTYMFWEDAKWYRHFEKLFGGLSEIWTYP